MARTRDYKAEYQRRIASGLKRGLSRSQSRGHPAISEPDASGTGWPKPDARLEAALRELRRGASQKAAARSGGVSREQFRRFIYGNKLAERHGRHWALTDERPRRVATIHHGETKSVTVANFSEARKAGKYFQAAGQFIRTNDITWLEPFEGDGLVDVRGKFFRFEINPNALYRHAAQDTPVFHEIYQIVS